MKYIFWKDQYWASSMYLNCSVNKSYIEESQETEEYPQKMKSLVPFGQKASFKNCRWNEIKLEP